MTIDKTAPSAIPTAYRIWYVKECESNALVVGTFPEPFGMVALAEPIDELDAAALEERENSKHGSQSLTCLFVAPNVPEVTAQETGVIREQKLLPTEVEPHVDTKNTVAQQAEKIAAHNHIINLSLRGDRITWRPKQALVTCASERVAETLTAIAYFSFYEAKLKELEHQIEHNWLTAKSDLALTHQLTKQQLRHWDHVSQMADWAFLSRMTWTQLAAFEKLSTDKISLPAKRLIGQFFKSVRTSDRLEIVDEQLELFEDLYELANDRISEYSYFLREYIVELWIIVVLVAEIALMIIELSWMQRG